MNVIINLPSEDNLDSKKLLQDSIDNFLTSLIVETINKLNADEKIKKSIANEIIVILNKKTEII